MSITATTVIETEFGPFTVRYHKINEGAVASFSFGDITTGTPIVRVHSACLFGEAFHGLHCDCRQQLVEALQVISKSGTGVIVYTFDEGRGIGLEAKIKEMELQRTEKIDTVEAMKKLGFPNTDMRDHTLPSQVLVELGVSKTIILSSGNPHKKRALEAAGFHIAEQLQACPEALSDLAQKERDIKREKMDYTY